MSLSELKSSNSKENPINTFYINHVDAKTADIEDIEIGDITTSGDVNIGGNLEVLSDLTIHGDSIFEDITVGHIQSDETIFTTGTIGAGLELNAPKINVQGDSSDDLIVFTNIGPTILMVDGPQAAGRRYTIPDVGADAKFILNEGNQNIDGIKTFEDSLTQSAGPSETFLTLPNCGATFNTMNDPFSQGPIDYVFPHADGTTPVGIIISEGFQNINGTLNALALRGHTVQANNATNQIEFGAFPSSLILSGLLEGGQQRILTIPQPLGNGFLIASTRGTVTQLTSINTDVTLNGPSGVITTFTTTTAPGAHDDFKLINSVITTSTPIGLTVNGYSGTGIPYPVIISRASGSCIIRLYNTDPALNDLNAPVQIYFQVG